MAGRPQWNFASIGLTNSVQPYWRFATQAMQMTPMVSCNHGFPNAPVVSFEFAFIVGPLAFLHLVDVLESALKGCGKRSAPKCDWQSQGQGVGREARGGDERGQAIAAGIEPQHRSTDGFARNADALSLAHHTPSTCWSDRQSEPEPGNRPHLQHRLAWLLVYHIFRLCIAWADPGRFSGYREKCGETAYFA